MGSIRQRSLTDGTIRYRAEICINRQGYPEYKESKTFNSRRIAENWLHQREKQLKDCPELLSGRGEVSGLTLWVGCTPRAVWIYLLYEMYGGK